MPTPIIITTVPSISDLNQYRAFGEWSPASGDVDPWVTVFEHQKRVQLKIHNTSVYSALIQIDEDDDLVEILPHRGIEVPTKKLVIPSTRTNKASGYYYY